MVRAWMRRAKEDRGGWSELDPAELPAEALTIRVSHSALNYKDALSLTGKSPIMRRFPMVAGADLAGTVESDTSGTFKAGETVVVTGFGLSETSPGGYAELAKVKPEWAVRVPSPLTAAEAAGIGTAGLTAALSVDALEAYGIRPDQGPVLVTGPTGGVGSQAVALLSAAGYTVHAATGKVQEGDFLKAMGASEIIDRKELESDPKPLAKERWRAAIDVVGDKVLANVISQIQYHGAVAACGLAASMNLPVTVAPFILRGVALLGVDSVMAPIAARQAAWARLARDLDRKRLAEISQLHKFSEADRLAQDLIDQKIRGRVVFEW